MIIINISNNFIVRKLIYFAEKPDLKEGLFNNYIQCFDNKNKIGFKRVPFYTKHIDLSDNRFIDSFNSRTIYQIRKAKKDGVLCKESKDISEFIPFYNEFRRRKKLSGLISEKYIKKYGNTMVFRTASTSEGTLLVWHVYLIDDTIKRVRLLYSVSKAYDENTTSITKEDIGRANRLLHYEDMLFFKELGFLIYDLGGYAYNTTDKSLQGINYFKDSFGGKLVEESNFENYVQYIFNLFKNFINELLRSLLRSSSLGVDERRLTTNLPSKA